MLESLICDKTGGGKMKKDIKDNVAKIETFHKDSFFWDYLINFSKSLKVRAREKKDILGRGYAPPLHCGIGLSENCKSGLMKLTTLY